ncbi:hypothetical protein lam_478 [Candidatus Liberibacter americanus str. Sao Paulo]|uniref:Uncharacterized protein n=1 Tax=Candidatus Liberibacter americanus str. Sao Paulo TaxID=1261131 RepID=U6B5C7_9HYPH|nr:hypothetical protein lam_478 [Candidatus Liberibacter americanus str. Sao Paulo]
MLEERYQYCMSFRNDMVISPTIYSVNLYNKFRYITIISYRIHKCCSSNRSRYPRQKVETANDPYHAVKLN